MNCLLTKSSLSFLVGVLFFSTACRHKEPAITEEQYRATRRKMVEVNRILVQKDQQRIKGYLQRQQIDMKESETGLWYEIIEEGAGEQAADGKIVRLKFRLNLMDGKVCYNSEKDGVKEFLIGKGGVESGLEEGILMLKEGGKARFIMPPHLAHGLTGDGNCIPARAIIIYEIEVLSIK